MDTLTGMSLQLGGDDEAEARNREQTTSDPGTLERDPAHRYTLYLPRRIGLD
jgi:hypothetical protein